VPDRVIIAGVLLAAFVMANLVLARWARPRSSPSGPVAGTEPQGLRDLMLAAYARSRPAVFLFRQAVMARVLTCVVVDLAVRGFITLHHQGSSTVTLNRREPERCDIGPEEATFLDLLLPPGDFEGLRLTTEPEQARVIAAWSKVLGPILDEFERRHFHSNKLAYFAGIAIAIVIAHIAIPAEYGVGTPPVNVAILWALGLCFVVPCLRLLMTPLRSRIGLHRGLVMSVMSIVGMGILGVALLNLPRLIDQAGQLAVYIALFAPTLAIIADAWLAQPSPVGRKVLDALERFHGQMSRGSLPPSLPGRQPNVSRFEQGLPYAMALGITEAWEIQCRGDPVGAIEWCLLYGNPVTNPGQVSQMVSGPLEHLIEISLWPSNTG